MYTIFRESEWFGAPVVKEFLTRRDIRIAEENLAWERQMSPEDMVWEEVDDADVHHPE